LKYSYLSLQQIACPCFKLNDNNIRKNGTPRDAKIFNLFLLTLRFLAPFCAILELAETYPNFSLAVWRPQFLTHQSFEVTFGVRTLLPLRPKFSPKEHRKTQNLRLKFFHPSTSPLSPKKSSDFVVDLANRGDVFPGTDLQHVANERVEQLLVDSR
jgi:hypothetical protein